MTGRLRAPFGTITQAGTSSVDYRASNWDTVRMSWRATMYQTRPNSDVAIEMHTASYAAPSRQSIDADLEWVIERYEGAFARLARD